MEKILFIIFMLFIPSFVYSTDTTVQATNDGYVSNTDAVYNTARDSATGDATSTSNVIMGQYLSPTPESRVQRSFLSFSIPAMSVCSACSLYLKGAGADYSDDNFGVFIHTSTYGGTIATSAFDEFDGWTSGSSHTGTSLNETWNSSSFLVNDWINIEFNADGRAAVLSAQGSTLYIAIISEEDFNRSAPTDKEYLSFRSSVSAGVEPYISFSYTTTSGYTGTACGLDNPKNVIGVPKASLKNFNGVE